MEIERLRKELTDLLENITDHSRKYSDERTIPSLEVGVVLTKVNKVQEKMAVLRHLLEKQELASKLSRQERRVEKPEKVEEVIIQKVVAEPVEIVQEQKIEEAPLPKIMEEAKIDLPISKLVDSLTLNDRYLYANELFNKDMSAFNDMVKAIDECKNFDQAQKLYVSLDWEIENEHVLSFTDLVERRFS